MAQEVKIGAALTLWRGAHDVGSGEAMILTIINTLALILLVVALLDRER